ncbi:MAG: exonuclease SbcCD subunit D [Chloroflexi bacterium]|nr:exonuclease SbcCD subunit D [Chloroflexota bacterium]
MIKLVCTADNHLGRYYGKMNLRQLGERRARLRQAFAETVDFAIKKRAHFFLQCGDLFDRESPPPTELTFVAQQFHKLREAGIRIYAISGNHDMPASSDGATPVRIYDALHAAHVFNKRTEIEFDFVKVEGTTVAIGGIAPDPRLDPGADPLDGVTFTSPQADVSLLLLHCGFEGSIPSDFAETILPKSRVMEMQCIDYYFLGDIHRTHKAIVEHSTVIIPGATERMTFGEIEEKPGFYYVELDGKNAIKLSHQSIEPQPMRREIIRTTDIDKAEPTEYVYDKLREWADKVQLMQLRIEGPLEREVYHRLRFYDVWRLGNEINFYFDLDRAAVTLKGEDSQVIGTGEVVSIRYEVDRVADELATHREGDDRALIEEARAMVMGKLGREE